AGRQHRAWVPSTLHAVLGAAASLLSSRLVRYSHGNIRTATRGVRRAAGSRRPESSKDDKASAGARIAYDLVAAPRRAAPRRAAVAPPSQSRRGTPGAEGPAALPVQSVAYFRPASRFIQPTAGMMNGPTDDDEDA